MIIRKTPSFDRKFKKLSEKQKEDFFRSIKLLYKNIFHPQLKTHKLKGKWASFHSFRINYSDRCIFYFINPNEIAFYDIGSHKIYE
jgi:addiction module RelE/StbE family toxin